MKIFLRFEDMAIEQQICECDKTKMVELMLQNSAEFGIDLNVMDGRGMTAFHRACQYGQKKTAELMIKNSRKIKIDLNAKDWFGLTAYQLCCIHNQTEIKELLTPYCAEFKYLCRPKEIWDERC